MSFEYSKATRLDRSMNARIGGIRLDTYFSSALVVSAVSSFIAYAWHANKEINPVGLDSFRFEQGAEDKV